MSDQTITFQAGDHTVSLGIITERPSDADQTTMLPCWELQLIGDGRQMSYYGDKDDALHGYCLLSDMGRIVIPVPDEHAPAIRDLIAKHTEIQDAHYASADAAYADRLAFRGRVLRGMNA